MDTFYTYMKQEYVGKQRFRQKMIGYLTVCRSHCVDPFRKLFWVEE